MRFEVQGRVQGVFFRASTREQARLLNVTGWVRNLANGNVEVLAEGERELVQNLAAWCQKGPPGAVVANVHVKEEIYTGEWDSFHIRY
jgi:acylphosphatase